MDTAPGERVYLRCHPSWLTARALYLRGLLVGLVLGVAAGIGSVLSAGRAQTSWILVGVLVPVARYALKGHLRRMRVTYTVTDRRVTVASGLRGRRRPGRQRGPGGRLGRRRRRGGHEAWLEHVETVRARQSLVERMLGIGTVELVTSDGGVTLRGIDDPRRVALMLDRARRAATGRQDAEDRWDDENGWDAEDRPDEHVRWAKARAPAW